MSATDRSLLVTAAVYVGAVIIVGLPATAVLSNAFTAAAEAIGWNWVADSGGALVAFAALLIGLQLAFEAAALQLGGVAALDRGSPRVALVRRLALAAGVVVALAVVTRIALSATFGGYGPVIVALGALVAVAAVVVLYRSASAFLAGLRSRSVGVSRR